MLISTFNVNSVRTRLPILQRWLSEMQPDLLFLQETKTQDSTFPAEAFSSLGYHSFYHGEKTYNGIAALIRKGLDGAQVTFGLDDGEFASRALTFRLGELVILNTYVPQGESIDSPKFTLKKEFLGHVRSIIERESKGLFLWLGDMNVAIDERDLTHPETKKHHVCFCDEIRSLFAQTRAGLVDLLRKFNQEAGVFTFYDYRVKDALSRNIGWRIDHMMASERLAELAVNCWTDVRLRSWEKPSDHVPLAAEFQMKNAGS